ncbi:class C sortase [Alloscardovia venturai]|uniref:Class C sortase n=1 Tax=Alloscardovia venturai TaxID=1769421 RepID=A0ABW2Y6Y2_9BIFI
MTDKRHVNPTHKPSKSLSTRKRKKLIVNIAIGLVFAIGLGVLLYPQISQLYYRIESRQQVADFDETSRSISQEEINKRMKLAEAYNSTLTNLVKDPYGKDQKKQGVAEYARMLEVHEMLGHVEIPSIDVDIPIYAGTSEQVLAKGVGHLEGTSLPIGGNSTHTVLTAHSGYPTARLFTDIRKMKKGDKFYIHNLKTTLAYQVDQISVIEPTDFSKLLIVPGHDYATLLTCTPLYVNTHRLLVRGHRVPYVPAADEKIIAENRAAFIYKYLFYVSVVIIAVLVMTILYLSRKRKIMLKRLAVQRELMQETATAKGNENGGETAREQK